MGITFNENTIIHDEKLLEKFAKFMYEIDGPNIVIYTKIIFWIQLLYIILIFLIIIINVWPDKKVILSEK